MTQMYFGLQRKPRIGETLVDRNGARWVVTRFDSVHDEICHVRDEGGRDSMFIWSFRDGLNSYMSHAEQP